ncbi:hypothetical protein ASH01_11435 [Terrabacter sp. Soil811]|nr:hypothetical protein ASH01_11435 [Terrabacter sp. Soil811]
MGKTIQIAAAIGRLWRDELARAPEGSVLYVTAASLITQTVAELRAWLPTLSVGAALPARISAGELLPNVVVVSHDLVHAKVGALLRIRPRLVVVDEASGLKGGGVQFESVREVCDHASRVIVATATPIENNPLELWTLFELVGTYPLGSRGQFLNQYCRVSTFDRRPSVVKGWKSELHARDAMQRIESSFLRRTADQVGLRLPVREETSPVLVKLGRGQAADYAKAERINDPLRRHQRLREASRGAAHGSPLHSAAVALVRREVRQGRRVVLYTEYLDDLDGLHVLLEEARIPHLIVQGSTPQSRRSDAVDFFCAGGVPVLLGSRVLEYGLNLQSANTLVSVGMSYNPAREAQREGRLRRIGSPHRSFRHWLVLPDTDQIGRQMEILERKRETSDLAYGST